MDHGVLRMISSVAHMSTMIPESGDTPPAPTITDEIIDYFGADMVYLHWYANDAALGTADDFTGNGLTGTYVGIAASPTQTGPDGNEYPIFDGSGDYVEIADHTSLSVIATTAAKTFFSVFRTTATTNFQSIIDKRSGPADATNSWEYGFYLLDHDGGSPGSFKIRVDLYGNADARVSRSTTNAVCVAKDSWVVAAIVVPAYTSNTTATPVIYVDGSSIALTKVSETNSAARDTPAVYRIGFTDGSGPPVNAFVGSVALNGCITGVRNATEMSDLAAIIASYGF